MSFSVRDRYGSINYANVWLLHYTVYLLTYLITELDFLDGHGRRMYFHMWLLRCGICKQLFLQNLIYAWHAVVTVSGKSAKGDILYSSGIFAFIWCLVYEYV